MEIIVGKTAGFCYGVKRAVESTKKEIQDGRKVYCLGELVHNKQVTEELEQLGVTFINDIKEVRNSENSKVIIRAHGISKEVYEYAKQNKIDIVDYTCPNVLKVHKIAEKFSNEGYYILLTGKKDHPENLGTISYCKKYSIIEEPEQTNKTLEEFEKSGMNKILLISQTTYSIEKFYLIREMISYNLKQGVKFDIENTICETTELRQKEAEKMSQKVDCMIIVGGKNSSNTKKIYEISQKYCENTYLVEDSIDAREFEKYNKIGIMAGASTPKKSIEKVMKQLGESQ